MKTGWKKHKQREAAQKDRGFWGAVWQGPQIWVSLPKSPSDGQARQATDSCDATLGRLTTSDTLRCDGPRQNPKEPSGLSGSLEGQCDSNAAPRANRANSWFEKKSSQIF